MAVVAAGRGDVHALGRSVAAEAVRAAGMRRRGSARHAFARDGSVSRRDDRKAIDRRRQKRYVPFQPHSLRRRRNYSTSLHSSSVATQRRASRKAASSPMP